MNNTINKRPMRLDAKIIGTILCQKGVQVNHVHVDEIERINNTSVVEVTVVCENGSRMALMPNYNGIKIKSLGYVPMNTLKIMLEREEKEALAILDEKDSWHNSQNKEFMDFLMSVHRKEFIKNFVKKSQEKEAV